jgi:hypothetical protein
MGHGLVSFDLLFLRYGTRAMKARIASSDSGSVSIGA